eukprot:2516624-Prymnesium_polylepis.1
MPLAGALRQGPDRRVLREQGHGDCAVQGGVQEVHGRQHPTLPVALVKARRCHDGAELRQRVQGERRGALLLPSRPHDLWATRPALPAWPCRRNHPGLMRGRPVLGCHHHPELTRMRPTLAGRSRETHGEAGGLYALNLTRRHAQGREEHQALRPAQALRGGFLARRPLPCAAHLHHPRRQVGVDQLHDVRLPRDARQQQPSLRRAKSRDHGLRTPAGVWRSHHQ